ncbi:hypothetical protein TrST_g7982 [Triparma strigata]|uniref:PNPLA domain-containing protein n=1 Tax=Triparma strigata TaxID=1606541 RepID=A0A9W7EBJ4_9STRA|nr:hypothetical protein TrST_g7982 [Triparma strigata]
MVAASLVGFSFSVAGLLFPYHIGVSSVLKESDEFTNLTPINGASGGALAACCLAGGLSDEVSLATCQKVADRCNAEGAFLNLGKILREELNDLVDEELLRSVNERPGSCEFSYTSLNSPLNLQPRRPSQPFKSRENLIDVLCASSHIPLYSSIIPFVKVNNELGADGFLSSPDTLGMKPTSADTTIFVTPFSLYQSMDTTNPDPNPTLIAPLKEEIPFSSAEYVNLALGRPGPSPSDQEKLLNLGKYCAERWLENYKNYKNNQ